MNGAMSGNEKQKRFEQTDRLAPKFLRGRIRKRHARESVPFYFCRDTGLKEWEKGIAHGCFHGPGPNPTKVAFDDYSIFEGTREEAGWTPRQEENGGARALALVYS